MDDSGLDVGLSAPRLLRFGIDYCDELANITHEHHGLVIAVKCGCSAIFNRNRKLETAICLIPKLAIPIELEVDLALEVLF